MSSSSSIGSTDHANIVPSSNHANVVPRAISTKLKFGGQDSLSDKTVTFTRCNHKISKATAPIFFENLEKEEKSKWENCPVCKLKVTKYTVHLGKSLGEELEKIKSNVQNETSQKTEASKKQQEEIPKLNEAPKKQQKAQDKSAMICKISGAVFSSSGSTLTKIEENVNSLIEDVAFKILANHCKELKITLKQLPAFEGATIRGSRFHPGTRLADYNVCLDETLVHIFLA